MNNVSNMSKMVGSILLIDLWVLVPAAVFFGIVAAGLAVAERQLHWPAVAPKGLVWW